MAPKKTDKRQRPLWDPSKVPADTAQEDSETALSKAVQAENVEEVRRILQEGSIDPEARDCYGWTALSHAAELGNESVVALLLKDNRINPDPIDGIGRTPLSRAAGGSHKQVVKMLIKQVEPCKVDLNSTDINRLTPLLWAMEADSTRGKKVWNPRTRRAAVIELLLACKRTDPNCRDGKGQTPLSLASARGDQSTINALLNHEQIDVNTVDDYGRTPLTRATEGGHYPVVRALVERIDIDLEFKDLAGRTPFSWAMTPLEDNECAEIARLLLDTQRVDINSRDNEGRTPLAWAIEHNGPTNDRCFNAEDPWPATNQEWPSIFPLLLEQDSINLEAKDNHGRTALSRAAEKGQVEVVRRLCQQEDVNTDSRDNYDRTPLWWAAKVGHTNVAQELIKYGADPELMDKDGHTPLSSALKEGQKEVDHLLKRDTITIHALARTGRLDLLRSLLTAGGDVNTKNIRGRTPLHTATLENQYDIAEELLHQKADVNCKDTSGITPLQIALERKHQDIIRLLLEHSAHTTDIKAEDWLKAYDLEATDTVLELFQQPCEKTTLQTHHERPVKFTSNAGPTRRLLLFTSYSTWTKTLFFTPSTHNPSLIAHDIRVRPTHIQIFLSASFPHSQHSTDSSAPLTTNWTNHGISWTLFVPSKHKDIGSWVSIDHYSTLPYFWIPASAAAFFALFIRKLKEDWLALGTVAEERLSQHRLDQLRARGNSILLIHRLASEAQEWATLRTILRGQISSARAFVAEYCRAYDEDKGEAGMRAAIDGFADEVYEQIGRLDQTVKDLLQFEFAWVSINEAHRSTSIATSIQRLSWITFIFLPAMFASSLFGMNVDILESNPDWRWYLLFGGGCVTLTVLVWVVFKHGRKLGEDYLGLSKPDESTLPK